MTRRELGFLIEDVSFVVERATELQSQTSTMVGRDDERGWQHPIRRMRRGIDQVRDQLDELEYRLDEIERSIEQEANG